MEFQAERLGRLEVDDEFERGSLDDRQITGLFAFENPPGVDAPPHARSCTVAEYRIGQKGNTGKPRGVCSPSSGEMRSPLGQSTVPPKTDNHVGERVPAS